MQNVVGIRLKDTGKIYDFDPSGLELKAGDMVIVDSEKGPVIGKVVREAYEIDLTQQIQKIIRKASKEDVEKVKENEGLRKESYEFCRAKIKGMGLPMRLIETELSFDGSKAVFYFTSEGRVDFRELVKELAAKFRIRIEMKQIGVRDEARLIGGFGCCGRALCCETFIKDFEPVSIRMAKKQELALNPAKISGVCGRLMCCLVFEYEIYDEIKKDTNELRNIEKPYPTDLGQVTETPSAIN
ncbi:MAG: stage 0 sporulation protein, partial [Nitrospirae bacterium]|nr:stage 0 sporulation protein [Nitrospirota bacterium]